MNFKLDDNLQRLAAMSGHDTVTFTACVLHALNDEEITTDDYIPEYFGKPLKDCQERDVSIKEIKKILHDVGIRHVDGDILDMFGNLILMGGYDCPVCGGKLEYDSTSDETTGDGYTTPIEPLYEIWVCPECGEIVKR